MYVRIDPQLRPLRSDPRYRDLIRRMGLLTVFLPDTYR